MDAWHAPIQVQLERTNVKCVVRFQRNCYCGFQLFALLLLMPHPLPAQKMKPTGISAKWAKDVDIANRLPKYPLPQMVRSQWPNLNGIWQVRSGTAEDLVPIGEELRGR
jgi:hypothetical protein